MISLLAYWFFSSMLFNYMCLYFSIFFLYWFLVSFLLWLEKILDIIPLFLNLLKDLSPSRTSMLVFLAFFTLLYFLVLIGSFLFFVEVLTMFLCSFPKFSQSVSSITQSCPTICDPMNCHTPGFPVLHYFPGFAQSHVHWISDAI